MFGKSGYADSDRGISSTGPEVSVLAFTDGKTVNADGVVHGP